MTVTRHRCAEDGQALILALAILALMGAFSVAILRFVSAAQGTLASTREVAYRESLADAAALSARDVVADGLACQNVLPIKVNASGQSVTVSPNRWPTPTGGKPPCAPGAPASGAYCVGVVATGGTTTINAAVTLAVDDNRTARIVHLVYGTTSC